MTHLDDARDRRRQITKPGEEAARSQSASKNAGSASDRPPLRAQSADIADAANEGRHEAVSKTDASGDEASEPFATGELDRVVVELCANGISSTSAMKKDHVRTLDQIRSSGSASR